SAGRRAPRHRRPRRRGRGARVLRPAAPGRRPLSAPARRGRGSGLLMAMDFKQGWALLRMALDRASLYLPIILMGALALGTYWLVRNAPRLVQPAAKEAPVHEPDFFMRDFTVKNFLGTGQLRSEMTGTEGRHYPDTDTLEVDQ